MYLFGAFIAALIVVYMARPNFRRAVTSAAVFFRDDPAAASASRFGWSPPRPTRSFYGQLAVLVLLLLAVPQCHVLRHGLEPSLGLWVLVDRSASMSTRHQDGSRMQRAVAQLETLLSRRWTRGYCVKLSTFDMELRDVRGDLRTVADVMREASSLSPRALGTDVALIARALKQPRRQSPNECRIDSAAVITDMPAPAWMDEAAAKGDVWIDVSEPVGNLGLTELTDTRDQFTGRVERVAVRVEAFGEVPRDARLTVTWPGGVQKTYAVQPWVGPVAVVEIKPDAPGIYRMELSPGGAYAYDDRAVILVPAADGLRVDWRVGQRDWLRRLGWKEVPRDPDLRVLPANALLDERPAILVGSGYAPASAVQPIADFLETSPLLTALNLDVAERAGMRAAAALPTAFEPVLRGRGGAVWIAQRHDPPAVYVPGLPLEGDGSLPRFSSTVFFNAARWILQRRPLPPLFTLTSPDQPEPVDARIALHPSEGNTARTPRSVGSLEPGVQRTAASASQARAVWPWFVAAAAIVFVIERCLSLLVGVQ